MFKVVVAINRHLAYDIMIGLILNSILLSSFNMSLRQISVLYLLFDKCQRRANNALAVFLWLCFNIVRTSISGFGTFPPD